MHSKLFSFAAVAMLATSATSMPTNLEDRGILDGVLGGGGSSNSGRGLLDGIFGGGSGSGGASRFLGGGSGRSSSGGGGGGAAALQQSGPDPAQIASVLQNSQNGNGGLDFGKLASAFQSAQAQQQGGQKLKARQLEGLGLNIADLLKGIAVGPDQYGDKYKQKYAGGGGGSSGSQQKSQQGSQQESSQQKPQQGSQQGSQQQGSQQSPDLGGGGNILEKITGGLPF